MSWRDECIQRVQMCLAEAGFPGAIDDDAHLLDQGVPPDVLRRAYGLALGEFVPHDQFVDRHVVHDARWQRYFDRWAGNDAERGAA